MTIRPGAPRTLALGLLAVVVLAACGGVPFIGGQGPGVAGGTIKVAVVDVFSGSPAYSYMGPILQNSVQVAIDDLNSRGGLLGDHVQLLVGDDQYSQAQTTAVVKQVLTDHSVKLIVGPNLAGLYLSAKGQIERARMPNCVTSMAADDLMTSAPYTFRAQEPYSAHVPAVLGYIHSGTQLKKIGLIAEDDSTGQSYDSQLSAQAGHFGLTYAGAALVIPSADQKAQVQQMLKLGVDALMLSNNPDVAARTLQAIHGLNADSRLHTFGFNGLSSFAFVQQAGDAANGVTFVAPIHAYISDVPEARWPAGYRDFAKRVISRFGTGANGVEMNGLPAAADCIYDWARAVQAANAFDGSRVVNAWQALDVPIEQSVLGVHEHFSPTDHDAIPPDGLTIYQWAKAGGHWGLKQLAPAS
jgi:branched-chain amino acid transport system substrate-binding protein